MNAHAVPYPPLQRRLISQRRSRALFFATATQHVRSGHGLFVELVRATVALGAVVAWCSLLFILAA